MPPASPPEELPQLALSAATADAYCEAILSQRGVETWWYLTGLAPYRGYSRPFRDRTGRWWWCVKPHFAWPLDFFEPPARAVGPPRVKCLLGYQDRVPEDESDSRVWMNVIPDVRGYGVASVEANKRRAVRKGLKELELAVVDPGDPAVVAAAHEVWVSHVQRTGWNQPLTPARFRETWRQLANIPGTTVLTARDPRQAGLLCAWLIGRVVGGVAYVDTIASHTERLAKRPNDALVFAFVAGAARLPGVTRAHYSLVSSLGPLERFKRFLGFVPTAFPARLHVLAPLRLALRCLRPGIWARLRGEGHWDRVGEETESCSK